MGQEDKLNPLTLEDLLRTEVILRHKNGKEIKIIPDFKIQVIRKNNEKVHIRVSAIGFNVNHQSLPSIDFAVQGNELKYLVEEVVNHKGEVT